MTPTPSPFQALHKAEGAESICKHGVAFLLVRMRGITATADGVKATMEVIADLASITPIRKGSTQEVSASWAWFSYSDHEWYTPDWHVYHDPELIRSIKATATWGFRILPRSLRRRWLEKLLVQHAQSPSHSIEALTWATRVACRHFNAPEEHVEVSPAPRIGIRQSTFVAHCDAREIRIVLPENRRGPLNAEPLVFAGPSDLCALTAFLGYNADALTQSREYAARRLAPQIAYLLAGRGAVLAPHWTEGKNPILQHVWRPFGPGALPWPRPRLEDRLLLDRIATFCRAGPIQVAGADKFSWVLSFTRLTSGGRLEDWKVEVVRGIEVQRIHCDELAPEGSYCFDDPAIFFGG